MTLPPRSVRIIPANDLTLDGKDTLRMVIIEGTCEHERVWGRITVCPGGFITDWPTFDVFKEMTPSPPCGDHTGEFWASPGYTA